MSRKFNDFGAQKIFKWIFIMKYPEPVVFVLEDRCFGHNKKCIGRYLLVEDDDE